MAEYDFPPEPLDRRLSSQYRLPGRTGSAMQYPSSEFNISPSDYGRGGPAMYGRTPSSQYRRGRQSHQMDDRFLDQGRGPFMEAGMHNPQIPGSYPHSNQMVSRQPSMNEFGMFDHSEMPPLEEHYDHVPSRRRSRRRSLSRGYSPPFSSANQFPPYANTEAYYPPIQMPTSAEAYSSRRRRRRYRSHDRSDRSYSDESYSDDSLSSREYDYGRQYSTAYPTGTNPTVIQPSRDHPIVVPINGGSGGYVVVPPVGQNVRVVDPTRPYKDMSLIDRILSPSTWGILGRKRHIVIR